jgi:ABC-type polysaccharide/polyol phosphate export permease
VLLESTTLGRSERRRGAMATQNTTIEHAPGAVGARSHAVRRHLPLFRNLVRREVRQRYKGSALGVAWTLVTPAIMVGAYSLVFRFLFKIDIPNYALFLFVGLTAWQFFLVGVQIACSSLVSNANLVKKVSVPRWILPLAAMTGNAVTAAAMLAVALPLCMFLTEGSMAPLAMLPVMIVLLGMLTVGLGLACAAINVYFRDVEHIIAAISLPWIFVTPIFYQFDKVPGISAHSWLEPVLHYANPVSPPIIALQQILFWGAWPALGDVLYSAGVGSLVLVLGWWTFRRLEGEMAVEL